VFQRLGLGRRPAQLRVPWHWTRRSRTSHLFRAWYLLCLGLGDSATAELRTALRLDPLNPVINARMGSILVQTHHYREGEAVYRQALALDSTNLSARSELGLALGSSTAMTKAWRCSAFCRTRPASEARAGGWWRA